MKTVRIEDLRWGTVDHTNYAIVELAPFTATGLNEIQATFIKKMTAEEILKQYVPNARHRNSRYAIVRLEKKSTCVGTADTPTDGT